MYHEMTNLAHLQAKDARFCGIIAGWLLLVSLLMENIFAFLGFIVVYALFWFCLWSRHYTLTCLDPFQDERYWGIYCADNLRQTLH